MLRNVLLAGMLLLAVDAHAFRCGNDLAYEGMHKYEIVRSCGQPVSKEAVGVEERGRSWKVVEEWLYAIPRGTVGDLYLIKFDRDGKAQSIQWLGETR